MLKYSFGVIILYLSISQTFQGDMYFLLFFLQFFLNIIG